MPHSHEANSLLRDLLVKRYNGIFQDTMSVWDIWDHIHIAENSQYRTMISINFVNDPIKVIHIVTGEVVGAVYINDPEMLNKLDNLVIKAINIKVNLPKLEI